MYLSHRHPIEEKHGGWAGLDYEVCESQANDRRFAACLIRTFQPHVPSPCPPNALREPSYRQTQPYTAMPCHPGEVQPWGAAAGETLSSLKKPRTIRTREVYNKTTRGHGSLPKKPRPRTFTVELGEKRLTSLLSARFFAKWWQKSTRERVAASLRARSSQAPCESPKRRRIPLRQGDVLHSWIPLPAARNHRADRSERRSNSPLPPGADAKDDAGGAGLPA